MKNRLLPLFFVLGAYSAYSQVGIGKLEPNPSTQLEVFSGNKGILIPRVPLKSSTDKVTVINGTGGYENSLMVFNTAEAADLVPGYYYWYIDRWQKLAISTEVKGGLDGGQGVPGRPGTPGIDGSIKMYVDYTTGIVYVRDPQNPANWIAVNGKNGLDGKNGISGGNGVPGAAGTR